MSFCFRFVDDVVSGLTFQVVNYSPCFVYLRRFNVHTLKESSNWKEPSINISDVPEKSIFDQMAVAQRNLHSVLMRMRGVERWSFVVDGVGESSVRGFLHVFVLSKVFVKRLSGSFSTLWRRKRSLFSQAIPYYVRNATEQKNRLSRFTTGLVAE